MRFHSKFSDLFVSVILAAVVVLACLTFSPFTSPVPHRDSGIFLTIGSEILKGKVLYQQIWDNKQPLLYLFNAAGLWIGEGSVWGVWALETVLLVSALLIAYQLLRKTFSSAISFALSAACFFSTYQIMSGNFSEEYALFFQMSILGVLFLIYLPDQKRNSRPLAAAIIGVLTGLVFCLKQTYLDVAASAILYILFLACVEKDRKVWKNILWVMVGFALVNLPFFIYFYAKGALSDYLTSAYLFNRYYSSQGLLERMNAFQKALTFIVSYPFLFAMSCAWVGGFLLLLVKTKPFIGRLLRKSTFRWIFTGVGVICVGLTFIGRLRGDSSGMGLLEWTALILGVVFLLAAILLFIRKPEVTQNEPVTFRQFLSRVDWIHPGAAPLLVLGMTDLPIVLFTIALSGMNFTHYYISLFPALFLLLAGALLFVKDRCQDSASRWVFNAVLILLLVSGCCSPVRQVASRLHKSDNADERSETAAYLKSVTTPQDKILQWGWEAVIYYLADRESPTRYAIQFPLYFETPFQKTVTEELFTEIQTTPPLYIADTQDSGMPFIEGKTMSECLASNPADGNGLQAILNYVCSNYEFDKSIGSINLYHRK